MSARSGSRGRDWSKRSKALEFNSGRARRTSCWRAWERRLPLSSACGGAAFLFAMVRLITVVKDACASRWARASTQIVCSLHSRKRAMSLALRKEHRDDEKRKHQARQQRDADSDLAHH